MSTINIQITFGVTGIIIVIIAVVIWPATAIISGPAANLGELNIDVYLSAPISSWASGYVVYTIVWCI